MSREIKFRAWTNKGEESEYRHGMMYDLAFTEFAPVNDHLNSVNTWGELMQYTGLKDKNGTEIYEGDIVKSVSEIIKPFAGKHREKTGRMATTYKAIEYRDKCASFCVVGSALSSIQQNVASTYYEVIGNIYENPELLENNDE